MPLESAGLANMPLDECRDLLATHTWGRVVVSISAMPAALPVNYRVVGDDIVFRTSEGGKMAAALNNTIVAFEVDDQDPESHAGWSVLAVGAARHVTDPAELARIEAAKVESWLPDLPHYVAISIEHVSGRRLGPA